MEPEIVRRSGHLARLNRELETTREQLVRTGKYRSLGEMAAGVAQDPNNVLGVVLGKSAGFWGVAEGDR